MTYYLHRQIYLTLCLYYYYFLFYFYFAQEHLIWCLHFTGVAHNLRRTTNFITMEGYNRDSKNSMSHVWERQNNAVWNTPHSFTVLSSWCKYVCVCVCVVLHNSEWVRDGVWESVKELCLELFISQPYVPPYTTGQWTGVWVCIDLA